MFELPQWLGRRWKYWPLVAVSVLLAVGFWFLVPDHMMAARWRAFLLAFLCGTLVGVAEIMSRYRDEPLSALLSPFGLIYAAVNGAMSLAALLVIFKYSGLFPTVVKDGLAAAVTAGFGAAAVMRSKIAVIKGTDDKDISIGPDFVIRILLHTVDKNVDRFRAERRQAIVVQNLDQIRSLGSFQMASEYVLASLLAFQNLDDDLKQQLRDTFDRYEKKTLPQDLKYLAMGFVFLTLVGETHFQSVLEQAIQVHTLAAAPAPPAPPPTSPTS